MSPKLQRLVDDALQLSSDERAEFIHRVRESMESFDNAEIETAWMNEAERRWNEIETGRVTCVPADVALKRARDAIDLCE